MPPRSFKTTFSQSFRVIGDFGQVQFFEHQAAGLQALAMAGRAIFIDQCTGLHRCRRTGRGSGLLGTGRHLKTRCQS